MIIVLGGSGYVGGAFLSYLHKEGIPYLNVSRTELDYYRDGALSHWLRKKRPDFLINAAGFTGKPNVDACEEQKAETLLGNAVLPGIVRSACEESGIPWAQVSSGCIYSGRREDGAGFAEDDQPNFSFRTNNCSFYSGSKALGEEVLEGAEHCYLLRLRIPFDAEVSLRNYLIKLMRYPKLLEAENSISHLGEFVRATVELWKRKLPCGTYNITQPGAVTTRQIVQWICEEGKRRRESGAGSPFPDAYEFFDSEADFMQKAAKTPRSNCVLDTTKIESTGIPLAPVEDKVRESLRAMTVPSGWNFRTS